MKYTIEIQNPYQFTTIPTKSVVQHWIDATLTGEIETAEVCIRIVDEDESKMLNKKYRHIDKATNILSFPSELPDSILLEEPLLGDLVLCAPLITSDAEWAHLIIHGVLHLIGYDHIEDTDAEIMEQKEINILKSLGYASPYGVIDDNI